MTPADFHQLRTAAGFSQGRLAALWGVRRATISDWERGRNPLPLWAVRLLYYEAIGHALVDATASGPPTNSQRVTGT